MYLADSSRNVPFLSSLTEPMDGWIMLSVNELYCGDNLEILREYIAPESVDLIYLDPPFNSDQNYNLLFREKDGTRSNSQILAFEDTWEWNQDAERTYSEIVEKGGKLGEVMELFRKLFDGSDMLAYLSMMAPRLMELRRVLKDTGAIYLHCDPTASHYLKMLMDAVFGPEHFKNEIVWQRTSAHNDPLKYGRVHDVLLFYSKGDTSTWNTQYEPIDKNYFRAHDFEEDENGLLFRKRDLTAPAHGGKSGQYEWRGKMPPKGRMWSYTEEKMRRLEKEGRIAYTRTGTPRLKIYEDKLKGVSYQDVWARPELWLNSAAKERVGYPTQKPQALLERIICASSSEGDVVLDPFCGCGTAIEAAHTKKRRWIGIDLTKLAIDVVRDRLGKIGEESGKTYQTIWEPRDLSSARALAADDPFQFQDWILKKLGGVSTRHRGADRGIDGWLYFKDQPTRPLRQIIVSVKSGKITPAFVRELNGTVNREKAAMGILATLSAPTKAMQRDATNCGIYKSLEGIFPKIQLVTVEQVFAGTAGKSLPPLQRVAVGQRRPSSSAGLQFSLPGMGELTRK
jgi:DNA modification methylase